MEKIVIRRYTTPANPVPGSSYSYDEHEISLIDGHEMEMIIHHNKWTDMSIEEQNRPTGIPGHNYGTPEHPIFDYGVGGRHDYQPWRNH